MTEPRYVDETELTSVHLMTPDLANLAGNVHGGHVVFMADNLAYICGTRFAGAPAVTAAIDRVDLFEPVYVGEALHLVARVVYAERSSLEVEVEVRAEDLATGTARLTTICVFTMVARSDGRAATVPALVPRTRADKARYARARERRALGLREREERAGQLARFDDLDDAALDALLARPVEGAGS